MIKLFKNYEQNTLKKYLEQKTKKYIFIVYFIFTVLPPPPLNFAGKKWTTLYSKLKVAGTTFKINAKYITINF